MTVRRVPILLTARAWIDADLVSPDAIKKYTYERIADVRNDHTFRWSEEIIEIPLVAEREGFYGFPRGDRHKLKKLIPGHHEVSDQRTLLSLPCKLELRDHVYGDKRWEEQERLLDEWINAGGGVVKSPAASGKSVLAIAAVCFVGLRTLILFDRRDFLDHWQREFYKHTNLRDIEEGSRKILGVLTKPDGVYPITLATFDMIRQPRFKACWKLYRDYFSLVIGDEVHHSAAPTRRRLLLSLNPIAFLGVTATPERKDKLERIYYDILGPIVAYSKTEMLPFTVYMHRTGARVKENRRIPEKFQFGGFLSQLVKNEERNRLLLKVIVRAKKEGRTVLVVTDRNAHAYWMQRQLGRVLDRERIAVSTGKTPKNIRPRIYADVDRGKYDVLIAGKVLDEGINIERLDTLVLATPFSSKTWAEQRPGRVRRPLPGKKEVEVHDFVDGGHPMIVGASIARVKVYREKGGLVVDAETGHEYTTKVGWV